MEKNNDIFEPIDNEEKEIIRSIENNPLFILQ
jgi:hypothetical protein